MIELFASMDRDNFEQGWAYRYKNTDCIIFFSKEYIFCYKCRELLDYFWKSMREKPIKQFNMVKGIKINPDVVLVLLNSEECRTFLKWFVNVKENKMVNVMA